MNIIKVNILLNQGKFEASIAILEEMKNKTIAQSLLAGIYLSLGTIQKYRCNLNSAIDFYENSLEIFHQSNNLKKIMNNLNNMYS